MGLFKKSNDLFSIKCVDRTLKNTIDQYTNGKIDSEDDYEREIKFLVNKAIKYINKMNLIFDSCYDQHTSDYSCDIPDFKTFLSLEQEMIDNQKEYQSKTICVEGYIMCILPPLFSTEWNRDTAQYWLYPLPCTTEADKLINFALVDDLHATKHINLVSDEPLNIKEAMHIRIHGIPYFYKPFGGGRPSDVHILVEKCEIIK